MEYLSFPEVARAFSTHNFEAIVDRMASGLTWTLIGGREYAGKDAVVAACRQSAEYLSDIATRFDSVRVIDGGSTVVVDTRTSYTEDDGSVSRVASCDIYDFTGELLSKITSYTIEF